MIPMERGSMNGRCCFKCAYRAFNEDKATKEALPLYCLEWQEPFIGDAGHVCRRFALDRTRYDTIDKERWEARDQPHGPQRSLDEWGANR